MTRSSSNLQPLSKAQWWQGIGLVLAATLFLSLQNVLVKIAQSPKPLSVLGGLLSLGGYVTPDPRNPFQITFLVLLIRIGFVVPLLWAIVPILKAGAYQEVKQIILGKDRFLQLRIVGAGVFLFISQICIYLAISLVGPATAVTLFFIYPTVTTLLAWKLFGDRPSGKQWLAIGIIYIGCIWLSFSGAGSTLKTDAVGLLVALLSGTVFALEGITAQSCFNKVSPATFTAMVFSVELVCLLTVTLPFIHISLNTGLLIMGGLLCCATLSGYLFNNFGIKTVGAAPTAIIGSSGPAVTSLLEVIILGTKLSIVQYNAIALVTVGVVLMNLAKMQTLSNKVVAVTDDDLD